MCVVLTVHLFLDGDILKNSNSKLQWSERSGKKKYGF